MRDFGEMLAIITPRRVGDFWFVGESPPEQQRIFGGQVLAQCLLAAYETVHASLLAHSMHAYFLRAGDPHAPIEFDVDPIRDGRSFCTRRVVARQHQKAIFNTSISFQVKEDGLSHQFPAPDAPAPETLTSVNAPQPDKPDAKKPWPLLEVYGVERRAVTVRRAEAQPAESSSWFRIQGSVADDPRIRQASIALMSDFSLLGTAFMPHPLANFNGGFIVASIDHAIWFHDDVDLEDFFLYTCDSPWSGGARGFNRGFVWSRDGRLIASTTQEGLMRPKTRD